MDREEALKIVQSATVWTDEEREALAMLIPELSESEDERIRRWLCDYFSSIDKAWIHKDITCIDILRWLEKQKEQKQEKFPPYVTGFKGDPDPAGTSDLEEAAEKYIQGSMCDLDDGPTVGLAKEAFIAGAEWQKEQKPAEWSQEDEKDMAHIIRILDDCYVYGTHDLSKTYHENLVNKLKSLRPSWKPSEQEKGALRTAIHVLTEERNFPKAAEHLQAILDAFEGKESRKDWKPSEEQMNALLNAEGFLRAGLQHDSAKTIAELYEQLKNLM